MSIYIIYSSRMESWQQWSTADSLPALLVESELPFRNPDPLAMLRCLLGYRVGGEERLRAITLSPDKTKALVQFSTHPGIATSYSTRLL